jgi:fluoroquinolone resistance protein
MVDGKYENINFREAPLTSGEYENCTFTNCDLSGADLSEFIFIECKFSETNLSNAKLNHTAFREVEFRDCKMVGLRFEDCLPFLAPPEFHNCLLKLSSFVEMKMPKATFRKCDLQEVDFTGADLSGSVFEKCDLTSTVFDNTKLEKADLRSSYNYSIDPFRNRIRKARFSLEGLPGLLGIFDIIIE